MLYPSHPPSEWSCSKRSQIERFYTVFRCHSPTRSPFDRHQRHPRAHCERLGCGYPQWSLRHVGTDPGYDAFIFLAACLPAPRAQRLTDYMGSKGMTKSGTDYLYRVIEGGDVWDVTRSRIPRVKATHFITTEIRCLPSICPERYFASWTLPQDYCNWTACHVIPFLRTPCSRPPRQLTRKCCLIFKGEG